MRQNWDKETLLTLTLAVYRVTAIFPKGEELGYKIRKSADDILIGLLTNKENCSRIDEIMGLFDLAEKKSLADQRNFLILRREYTKIRHESAGTPGIQDNRNRQEKIIEELNGNGTVKIGNVIKMFPGTNRRTILRDLEKLRQTGVIVKTGIGRGACYIKNAT